MRTEDLPKPTVPVGYALLLLDAAEAHGVSAETLLRAARVAPDAMDDPGDRMSVIHIAGLLEHAIDLTGEPALGYEIALGSSVTSHGIMGFGMMTCASLREAIELGTEFLHLRVPMLSAELRVEDDVAAVSVVETVPLGHLRRPLLDLFLVKLVRIGRSLTDHGLDLDDVELWFDYPEPEYHHRFRDRLPPMRFDAGANELRFDVALLDRRPDTADPVNARIVEAQCRREVERLGLGLDLVGQVRAALQSADDGYPTLVEVAEMLHTSSRTLKRRLHDHGTTFHRLVDAARRAEGIRLLTTTDLPVEQIARRLGYADASSFRRAFQAWTATTPSHFREGHREDLRPRVDRSDRR